MHTHTLTEHTQKEMKRNQSIITKKEKTPRNKDTKDGGKKGKEGQ